MMRYSRSVSRRSRSARFASSLPSSDTCRPPPSCDAATPLYSPGRRSAIIWSLQKHPCRATRKWRHSARLRRGPMASRLNLRFKARQVAARRIAFSASAKGTDPRGHAYDCSQEGGVSMTLGEEIRSHLPYLRRYARALTGSQQHGDNFVHTTLEVIVAAPGEFHSGDGTRIDLYRNFHRIWESAYIDEGEGAG